VRRTVRPTYRDDETSGERDEGYFWQHRRNRQGQHLVRLQGRCRTNSLYGRGNITTASATILTAEYRVTQTRITLFTRLFTRRFFLLCLFRAECGRARVTKAAIEAVPLTARGQRNRQQQQKTKQESKQRAALTFAEIHHSCTIPQPFLRELHKCLPCLKCRSDGA
jgi:hypothetical protein